MFQDELGLHMPTLYKEAGKGPLIKPSLIL
jgi:hypothetical protein